SRPTRYCAFKCSSNPGRRYRTPQITGSDTASDLTYPNLEEVWQALRESRSDPPGWAGSGNAARRKTYNSALEQAEQLLKAAAEVGPASRPLLLFYGLSQAGRAIAAAGQQPDYQLNGHGIAIKQANQPHLGLVRVADKGTGAFTQLASLLGSRSLPQEVELASLWSILEENDGWPLTSAPSSIRCLRITRHPAGPESFSRVTLELDGLPAEVVDHGTDQDQLVAAANHHLRAFPTIVGYTWAGYRRRYPEQEATLVSLAWPLIRQQQASDHDVEAVMNMLTPWSGRIPVQRRVHSVLGGDGNQIHPFLAWWAVLYALSMLARYQPGQWTTQIDVNHSADAAAVERLLSKALIAVPELALATIDEVSR
ncbi:YaaC family protein, partial [Streptomyces sp. NPDC051016]|uniref:YaaC family protein n=1 Tax=Streptomyces sp. NPDC051016 TaxID=3365638 RepID=UPI0037B555E6